jgi:hypothetical protein
MASEQWRMALASLMSLGCTASNACMLCIRISYRAWWGRVGGRE